MGMLTLVGRGHLEESTQGTAHLLGKAHNWQCHPCRGQMTKGKIYGERNGSAAVIAQTLSTLSHSTKSQLINNKAHQQRLDVHLLK